MNKKIVDMHVHSYYSDGSDSPAEIVKKAKKKRTGSNQLN